MSETYKTPLEKLGLSTRAYNALRRAGYETVEQVYYETDDVLSRKRNIGVVAMDEINHALEEWEAAQDVCDMTEKCCGTCRHHIPMPLNEWFCDNENADAYGCETEYNHGCEEWEER